ncbi:MAG: hypothetical protein ACPF8V_06295 [Luteibaculum sp.]
MKNISILLLLRICVFLTFVGRAYQHLRWGVNYRDIFWNYKLVGKWVEKYTDMIWAEYVSDPVVNKNIDLAMQGIGVVFLLGAFSALFFNQKRKWLGIPIMLSLFFYLIIIYLHFYGQLYLLPLAFEFAAQFACGILLLAAVHKDIHSARFNLWVKIIVAVTFTMHGLYACGILHRPATFLNMTMRGFGLSKAGAIDLLIVAGILDFIAAAMLFLKPTQRIGFIYCVAWGFATAFARIYANFYDYRPWDSLNQWTWEFFVRTSHYVLPLIGYLLSFYPKDSLVGKAKTA